MKKQLIRGISLVLCSILLAVNVFAASGISHNVRWGGSFEMPDNNAVTTAEIPVEAGKIQKVWDAPVGNSPIVILDDYIYTYNGVNFSGGTDNDGTLYKINKDNGEIVDQLTCEVSGGYYYSYIVYGDGMLYISGADKVVAVDPDTMEIGWYADAPAAMYQTLQFVGGNVFVRGYVLDAATGELIRELEGTYNYGNGVERNGVFYIAATQGTIYAYDTESWEMLASVQFRDSEEGIQPGVMYYNGRLFWGESGGNLYSIQVDEASGGFAEDTLLKNECGISTACTPVAVSDRVYLAGQKDGQGVVGVFNAGNISLAYIAGGAVDKIQSTPILREVKAGGPSIASANAVMADGPMDGNYVVVQDYGNSSGSSLWVLRDTKGATSGSLSKLVNVDPADYAYEQLAFDLDGSLYCTNDAGYLVKYRTAVAELPVFVKNLSKEEVEYKIGEETAPLKVNATVMDGGKLSYQWQSRTEGGAWTDIDGATKNQFTPSSDEVGTWYYRCVVTNTLSGKTAQNFSKIAKITVLPVVYGDVNSDGKVDAKDATVLQRYLAEWENIYVDSTAADVNLDGEVNAADAAILARFLAGWTGVTIGTK